MSKDFEPSQKVAEKLEIANRYWKIFSETLEKTTEPRLRAIFTTIIIEHYINEILILRNQMKDYNDKLRFIEKLELLKQVRIPIESIAVKPPENQMFTPLFLEEEVNHFEYIYNIRNMYAHEVEFNEKLVRSNLDRIKDIGITLPDDLIERYFRIAEWLMRKAQQAFMSLLVKEQEKFDENPEPFKL